MFITAHNASPISKMLVGDVVAFGSDAHCEINTSLTDSIFSGHILDRELVSSIGSAPMERHEFSSEFVKTCFENIGALVFTLVISLESCKKFIKEANNRHLPIFVCADSERRVLKMLELRGG